METSKLSNFTTGFALSLAASTVVNGLLVIAKEKITPLMNWMQKIGGHHWITHSVFIVAFFCITGLFLTRLNKNGGLNFSAERTTVLVMSGLILGNLILIAFYLFGG